MVEWLTESTANPPEDSYQLLLLRLSISLLAGVIVATIYSLGQNKSWQERLPFVTTLILLTILICMVTLVIGNSVARAFSLVGALAIVRFRTVVEDTRDTAFVIFAVVVGMAIGAGYLLVPLAGMPIVAFAAIGLSFFGRREKSKSSSSLLIVRMAIGFAPEESLQSVFADYLSSWRVRSVATARQGAAMDLEYLIQLQPGKSVVDFVCAVNRVEGVQNVESKGN